MKISRVLICALFAGLFLPITSPVAQAANTDINCGTSGFYSINETGVVVSSTNCVGTVNFGSNVTAIGRSGDATGVFQNNDSLTAISLASSVKEIQTKAFSGSSFTSITFAEGLETIAAYAFQNFNDTTQLDNVVLDFPNSLKSIGNYAFEQSTGTGKTGAVSFGDALENIGASAFNNTGGFGPTSITFRGDAPITTIPSTSFWGSRANEIVVPSNITTIGTNAFRTNINLVSFFVPNSVTTIDQRVFAKGASSSLRLLVLPDGLSTMVGTNALEGQTTTLKVVYCGTDSTIRTYLTNYLYSTCSRATQYNANGGVGSTIIETATADSNKNVAKTLRANTFTRSGYEFDGWNTKRDGSGTKYTDQQAFTQTNHLTLFAQWWDLSRTRPGSDNSAEERRKRQEKIDKNRLALVQKVKSGELIINPDLIDSDLPTLTVELREKVNNELASQSKSKEFSFKNIQKVVSKYDLYQAIQNGLKGIVTGRAAVNASIVASTVPQKELLISKLMALDPSKRSTVEDIDKVIAEFEKIQLERKMKLSATVSRSSASK